MRIPTAIRNFLELDIAAAGEEVRLAVDGRGALSVPGTAPSQLASRQDQRGEPVRIRDIS
jgi:hypothetical protein